MPYLKLPPYEVVLYCRKMQRKQFVEINYAGLKFRIIETQKGWICERADRNFWGRKVWIPHICYHGSNEPYPYIDDKSAYNGLIEHFKEDTMRLFYRYRN